MAMWQGGCRWYPPATRPVGWKFDWHDQSSGWMIGSRCMWVSQPLLTQPSSFAMPQIPSSNTCSFWSSYPCKVPKLVPRLSKLSTVSWVVSKCKSRIASRGFTYICELISSMARTLLRKIHNIHHLPFVSLALSRCSKVFRPSSSSLQQLMSNFFSDKCQELDSVVIC